MQNSMWLDTMGNHGSPISGELANTCLIVMFSTKIGQFQDCQQVYLQQLQIECSRHLSCWHSYFQSNHCFSKCKNIKVVQLIWLMFSKTAIKYFAFKVTDIFVTLSFHLIIYCREFDTLHLNVGRRKILVGYFNYQKPFPGFDIGSRLTMWLDGWLSSGWPWETQYHDLLEKIGT